MAKFNLKPKVSVEIELTLTESEARALEAISQYNADDFIELFYEHMGKSYLEPHEGGLRDFLSAARIILPQILKKIKTAREELEM